MENLKEKLRIANKVWDKVFGQVYDVESMDYYRKRQGVHYKVKHSGSDEWSCNCPSWKFKSGTEKVELEDGKIVERTCKHIRFVLEKEGIKWKVIY